MKSVNPYIGFNGRYREAMTFYHDLLGGELALQAVENSPLGLNRSGDKSRIFHASLTVNGVQVLMGSDMKDKDGYTKGNDIAIALECSNKAEMQRLFEKLARNGTVVGVLKDQPWGAVFGSLKINTVSGGC